MSGIALVTGSSGLLGACLVERLRARGTRIRLVDMADPSPDLPAPPDAAAWPPRSSS